eukprot:767995-Hanusia_phi.AAC.1
MFPITDKGVDKDLVLHNLNILLHIEDTLNSIDDTKIEVQKAQIFLTDLAWFYAAGISLDDLGRMCGNRLKQTLNANLFQMRKVWSEPKFTTEMVYCPLPVYMDVRYRSGKDNIPLFQGNTDSESLTIQWLLTLLLQFGIATDLDPITRYLDYTKKIRAGQGYDQGFPNVLMADVMKKIAQVLERKYSQVDFSADYKEESASFHVVFVLDDSGSMAGQGWSSLVKAVRTFFQIRKAANAKDMVSMVAFNSLARTLCQYLPLDNVMANLDTLLVHNGGGTSFGAGLREVERVLSQTDNAKYPPVILFMSDGDSHENGQGEMQNLYTNYSQFGLQVNTLAFGTSLQIDKLKKLAECGHGEFLAAIDGSALEAKFADVATNLKETIRNPQINQKKFTQDETKIQTQVVEDMVAIADFFSQLRSSEGMNFIASCIQGLCSGLQTCSEKLQVTVADTLYTLIGITPANEGFEVLTMLREWQSKGLVYSSSVLNEIEYIATKLYAKYGYERLSQDLLHLVGDKKHRRHKHKQYLRCPAQTLLPSKIDRLFDHEGNVKIYEDILYKDGFEFHTTSSPVVKTADPRQRERVRTRQEENRRFANFDHVRNNDRQDTQRIVERKPLVLFKNAFSSDRIRPHQSKSSRVSGKLRRDMKHSERTISARKLVSLNIKDGYGVVHIVPGLNPVLRSPGDSRKIPLSQQTNLRRGQRSFDEAELGQMAEIEAIFSHNGGAWEHLNQLPRLSTITAKGFYLRKNLEGDWMVLLGAVSLGSARSPPVFVCTLLDVCKLAVLDFDADVLETLKSLVQMAFYAAEKARREDADDSKEVDDVLNDLRYLKDNPDMIEYFQDYVSAERTLCKAILRIMDEIKDDDDGSNTVLDYLDLPKLEGELSVESQCLNLLGEKLSNNLSLIVGIRDPVPRSQLVFTLKFAEHNQNSFLAGLDQDEDGSEVDVNEDEDRELRISFDPNEVGPVFHRYDENSDSPHNTANAVLNNLLTAHEHITQQKFMEQSVTYLTTIMGRKRLNAQSVWIQHFEDSDSDGEEKAQDKVYTRKTDDNTKHLINSAKKERNLNNGQEESESYLDDSHDLPTNKPEDDSATVQASLFPAEWGYGNRVCSKHVVMSLSGEKVPLYQVQIDVKRLKIKYNERDGLPIVYVFHKSLLVKSLEHFLKVKTKKPRISGDDTETIAEHIYDLLSHRADLLNWLCNLVRSPLPEDAKSWFLNQLEKGPTTARVPSLCVEEGNSSSIGGDLNLLVIAHCVAVSLPSPNHCLPLFRNSFHVPPHFLPFCKRKNDLYGVHIVRGGTLAELKKHDAVVEVCDLGYDALTRSKDNASMYLTIIGHFSAYTWL